MADINSPAKILILLRRFPELGGLERMTAALANELARAGREVHVYAGRGSLPVEAGGLDPKVGLHIAEKKDFWEELAMLVSGRKIGILINQGCVAALNGALRRIRDIQGVRIISILHTCPRRGFSKPFAENEGAFWKRMLKICVWPVYVRWYHSKYRRNLRTTYNLSDRLVVLSQTHLSPLGDLLRLPRSEESKMAVIPNFLTAISRDVCGEKVLREKCVIYVGRLSEHTKRVSRIFGIWERIAPSVPEWRLEIIGDGPDRGKYERDVRMRGIPRVKFLGRRDDVACIMRRSAIILQVSDNEGMPMVIMEAMREGCVPIVYDSYSSARDLMEDGESGLLITPFDEDEYVSRMGTLLRSPQDLSRIREAAVKKSQDFNAAPVMATWLKLIDG